MASLSKEVTSGAKIWLRNDETNEEVSCELDVDPGIVVNQGGEILQATSFGFVQSCVKTDETLTEHQRKALTFQPESTEDVVEDSEQETQSPVKRLVKRLKEFANEAETKVREDPVIQEDTKKILSECVKRKSPLSEGGSDETDSGGFVTIDLGQVSTRVLEVFEIFLEDLKNPNVDAVTVLIRLGTALGYCWYLIKHIAIAFIDSTTFRDIAYITCKVIGFLFRHLVAIQFGSLLEKLGGWNSLLSDTMVDQGTRAVATWGMRYVPMEYLFLGLGVASLAMFTYMRFFRR